MLESTFNGAPFFGGLFAYAHTAPDLLSSWGVDPAPWMPTAAYGICILATWIIGGIINLIAERRDSGPESPESAARRHKVNRIARLFSTGTMLSGLLVAANNPATTPLETWPIAVMIGSYLLYEVLHWLVRRRRSSSAPTGDGNVSPTPVGAPQSPDAQAHEIVHLVEVGAGSCGGGCRSGQVSLGSPGVFAPVA